MMKLTAILLVFALSSPALTATAVSIHDSEWTVVDQEPDEVEEESGEAGSGDDSALPTSLDRNSEYQWITRSRNKVLHVANVAEIEELMSCIVERDSDGESPDITLVSQAPTQLEDGPTRLVDESDRRPPPPEGTQRPTVLGEYLEEVESTNFYPEYAVGILDNNCTAFLVGPRHALTTASCIYHYDNGDWQDSLDFWRGRNGDEYIEKMLWDHVIIPAKYFVTGNHVHNWALIVFAENSSSPVWLKMAHSLKTHDKMMTVYGYLPDDHPCGTMYNTVCRSDPIQNDEKCLAIQCGTNVKFSGGPVLRGYNFQRSKMPLVYGVSIANDYSYAHNALNIHQDLFWSLCCLLKNEGFDAQCGPQQQ